MFVTQDINSKDPIYNITRQTKILIITVTQTYLSNYNPLLTSFTNPLFI